MTIQLNVWSVFYACAAVQGYFLAVILFSVAKGSRTANRLLALLMLLFSIYLSDIFMSKAGLFYECPHLLYYGVPLWYLFAPLSYLYVRYLLAKPVRWCWWHMLHLLPFFLIIYKLFPFYSLPAEIKIQFWTGVLQPPGGTMYNFLFNLMNPVQLFLYSGFILKTIWEYPARQENTAGGVAPAHLHWLKIFVGLIALFAISDFIMCIYYFVYGEMVTEWTQIPLAIFSLILYGVAYLGIIRPEVLFPEKLLPKRNGSGIHGAQAKQYAAQLVQLMASEKPFLDPDLKYSDLAMKMGISTRYLTEILNREIGQSFHDFVNNFRVKEVQARMLDQENSDYTLLAIAMDAGFSSKSSFNRIFKKHTGLTPSQFLADRKSLQNMQ